MVGKQLGPYRIIEQIGAGGMGVVYRAHDDRLERDIALKVLPPGTLADPAARARLLKEARTASALNHPNICTIHDVGEADGRLFIAMEYVSGRPLSSLVLGGGLRAETVARYGAQVAEALAFAHDHGIIHRDLKTSNVMITSEGRAKVLDFGLAERLPQEKLQEATLTQATLEEDGRIAGTLPYMAPEVLAGAPLDPRSDVWALGVLLYEMTSGQLPFRGATSFALTSAILKESPAPLPPQTPAELRAVIERCLSREPGERYQRAGEVRAALEILRGSAGPSVAPSARLLAGKASRRKALGAAAGLTALGMGAALFRSFSGRASRVESMAVLPLKDLSRDPSQEYFADGMTDELITALSRISALRVIAHSSVSGYKDGKKPLPEVARELRVDALVEGSIFREGDQVRLTVQLVDGATGRLLWGERYQREIHSVLTLQNELARAIAGEISVRVTPQEQARLAQARPVRPEVLDAYLKGRYAWNKVSVEGVTQAVAYFQEAIAQDSGYAAAYAGLADCYVQLGSLLQVLAPKESYPKLEAAARKALEIDETIAEAHAAMGVFWMEFERNWAAAGRELKRALELNPSYATAHQYYGWYLWAVGNKGECLVESRRALELDPLSPFRAADLGANLYLVHRTDEAIAQLRAALKLEPNSDYSLFFLGLAYSQKGMHAEAIETMHKAVTVSGRNPIYLAMLAYVYALAGYSDQAAPVLRELRELASKKYVSSYYTAMAYAGLQDRDQAFHWLERAFEERNGWLTYMVGDPGFDNLRSDPRYDPFIRRLGFPR